MIILLFQVMALHLGAIQNADILSTVRVTELENLRTLFRVFITNTNA